MLRICRIQLAGCGVFSDPPTQLEAPLTLAGEKIRDPKALAAHFVEQLKIKELQPSQVRITFDSDKKQHFFRLVGKEALSATLIAQVANALPALNVRNAWQGRLVVDEDKQFDAFLKTSEREFPVAAAWHTATVEAYLMQNMFENALMRQMAQLRSDAPRSPQTVACMLSFTPHTELPRLTGKASEITDAPINLALERVGLAPREMTVPHKITVTEPAMAKLDSPVVEDGKILFQFALVEDAKVTVINTVGDTDPITFDHGAIELCNAKLAEVAPAARARMDQPATLAEIKAIGPARIVPLPKKPA